MGKHSASFLSENHQQSDKSGKKMLDAHVCVQMRMCVFEVQKFEFDKFSYVVVGDG